MKLAGLKQKFTKNLETESRVAYINDDQPKTYISNTVVTSKYTLLNFVFKNLWEQFHKITNCYFLVFACLQSIPEISTTNGIPTILLPLISVLVLSGIKDAYEDYLRHKSDDIENNRIIFKFPKSFRYNKQVNLLYENNVHTHTPNCHSNLDAHNLHTCENEPNEVKETYKSSDEDSDRVSVQDEDDDYLLELAGLRKIASKDLRVGDLLISRDHEIFPADLVLLASSDSDGIAFVETASLDGETNLKLKRATPGVSKVLGTSMESILENISNLKGKIVYSPPNKNLNNFDSFLYFNINNQSEEIPLTINNLLLRGCKQRNTEWLIGMVVYTGHDTKIQQNSTNVPRKYSKLDKKTNYIVLFFLIVQVALCLFCSINYASYSIDIKYRNATYTGFRYQDYSYSFAVIISFFTWINLTTQFVPISLLLTVAIIKAIQAYWIISDRNMFDNNLKHSATPRTTDLNEELGQIDYIFSDKTGTLTCNIMKFRKCCIYGIKYGDNAERYNRMLSVGSERFIKKRGSFLSKTVEEDNLVELDDPLLLTHLQDPNNIQFEKVNDFFFNLAINHSVVTEKDQNGFIKYSASSPDEGAFVETARYCGIEFMGRTSDGVEIKNKGVNQIIKILSSMDFTSERKRSSVLCEFTNFDGSKRHILYCKGADSMIHSLLRDKSTFDEYSSNVLDDFAKEGLRTLCLAKKELTNLEFEKWSNEFSEANKSPINRQELLDKCADNLECNLEFMGITGIEDRLQDDVQHTLTVLKAAGIKVWMLTGDKTETAINIGISSAIIHPTSFLIQFTSEVVNVDELRTNLINEREKIQVENFIGQHKNRCMILNGSNLWYLLEPQFLEDFLFICENCESVIACRVTPFQKGAIVTAVKRLLHKTTLAIGDGANDCNMIQKADVGVGIRGKEGLQAFNSSDYGICQFQYLKYLILVHGNWSYKRISKIIFYCFYKNVVLVFPLVFFGFFSMFSGQKIYSEFLYQLFNVFFTSFSISVMGIFDCELDRHLIMKYPELYKLNQKNLSFTISRFIKWMALGAYHGLIVLIVPIYTLGYNNIPLMTGETFDMWTIGVVVFLLIMIVVNLKVLIETDKFFWLFPLTIGLGFFSFMFIVLLLSFWPTIGGLILGVTQKLFSSLTFYIVILTSVGLSISLDMFIRCVQTSLYPSAVNHIQFKEFNKYNIFNNKRIIGDLSFVEEHIHQVPTPSPSGKALSNDLSFQEDKSMTGFAFSAPDKETYNFVQHDTH